MERVFRIRLADVVGDRLGAEPCLLTFDDIELAAHHLAHEAGGPGKVVIRLQPVKGSM